MKCSKFTYCVNLVFIFLIVAVLNSCGDDSPIVETTNPSDWAAISVISPDFYIPGLQAVSTRGDIISVYSQKNDNGILSGNGIYAIYEAVDYSGDIKVYIPEDGLPTVAIIGDVSYKFVNYRVDKGYVDVIVTQSDDSVEVFTNIQIPYQELSYVIQRKTAYTEVNKQLSPKSTPLEPVRNTLDYSMIGVKLASCIIVSATGAPALLAAGACGSVIDDVIGYINDGHFEPGITAIVECVSPNVINCVALVGDIASQALARASERLEQIKDLKEENDHTINKLNNILDDIISSQQNWELFHPTSSFSEPDVTPPEIFINTPKKWEFTRVFNQLRLVTKALDDVEVNAVSYVIKDETNVIRGSGSIEYTVKLQTEWIKTIDISNFSLGVYIIIVTARDASGNQSKEQSAAFEVINVEDECTVDPLAPCECGQTLSVTFYQPNYTNDNIGDYWKQNDALINVRIFNKSDNQLLASEDKLIVSGDPVGVISGFDYNIDYYVEVEPLSQRFYLNPDINYVDYSIGVEPIVELLISDSANNTICESSIQLTPEFTCQNNGNDECWGDPSAGFSLKLWTLQFDNDLSLVTESCSGAQGAGNSHTILCSN